MDTNQVTADATVALAVVGGLAFIANAVIAIFTLNAARATRRSAEATEKAAIATKEEADATKAEAEATLAQATIQREALEAGFRPFLVDVPYGLISAPPGGAITDMAVVETYKLEQGVRSIRVSLRNIGSGLAIITQARLSVGQLHSAATRLSSSIVGVGEAVRITFDAEPKGAVLVNLVSQLDANAAFIVTVRYTDQRGVNTWRSRASFKWVESRYRYYFENIELYAGDDIEPFATGSPVE